MILHFFVINTLLSPAFCVETQVKSVSLSRSWHVIVNGTRFCPMNQCDSIVLCLVRSGRFSTPIELRENALDHFFKGEIRSTLCTFEHVTLSFCRGWHGPHHVRWLVMLTRVFKNHALVVIKFVSRVVLRNVGRCADEEVSHVVCCVQTWSMWICRDGNTPSVACLENACRERGRRRRAPLSGSTSLDCRACFRFCHALSCHFRVVMGDASSLSLSFIGPVYWRAVECGHCIHFKIVSVPCTHTH